MFGSDISKSRSVSTKAIKHLSRRTARAIQEQFAPTRTALGSRKLGEEQWITAAQCPTPSTGQEQGRGKGERPDCKEETGLEQLMLCQKSC